MSDMHIIDNFGRFWLDVLLRTVTVDLRSPGEERLSLSSAAPEKGLGAQMLDLRPSGAPVRYYAVEATGLRVAGQRLELPGPLVAVLDTGTTGLGLPSKLFESYDRLRREVAQDYGLQRAQAGRCRWGFELSSLTSIAMAGRGFAGAHGRWLRALTRRLLLHASGSKKGTLEACVPGGRRPTSRIASPLGALCIALGLSGHRHTAARALRRLFSWPLSGVARHERRRLGALGRAGPGGRGGHAAAGRQVHRGGASGSRLSRLGASGSAREPRGSLPGRSEQVAVPNFGWVQNTMWSERQAILTYSHRFLAMSI